MSDHKFRIGESLSFMPHRIGLGKSGNTCKVVRLLSTDGADPQYRIKCSTESFERVVRESELR